MLVTGIGNSFGRRAGQNAKCRCCIERSPRLPARVLSWDRPLACKADPVSIPSTLPPTTALRRRYLQIRLPMAGNPMRYVNGYVLEDGRRATLIDCGWKADDVRAALDDGSPPTASRCATCGGWSSRTFTSITTVWRASCSPRAFRSSGCIRRTGAWCKARAAPRRRPARDAWLERNGLHAEVPDGEDEQYDRYDLSRDPVARRRPTASAASARCGRRVTPPATCASSTRSRAHVPPPTTCSIGHPHVGLGRSRAATLGDYVARCAPSGGWRPPACFRRTVKPSPTCQGVESLWRTEATRKPRSSRRSSPAKDRAPGSPARLRLAAGGDRFDQLSPRPSSSPSRRPGRTLEHLRLAGAGRARRPGDPDSLGLKPSKRPSAHLARLAAQGTGRRSNVRYCS